VGLRPELTVEISRVGDASVVSPHGEIDIATAAKVQDALDQARGAPALIFDLRGVEFIDTSGLRLIVAERQRAEHDGYGFAVVRGSRQVQKLLAVAGYPHEDSLFVDDPAEFTGGGRN
jgi:anti-sigma B factor antagonist